MKAQLTRFALTLAVAAILIVAAAAPAAAATQTFHSQDNFSIFVPCANGGSGESVDGILKIHAVFGQTFDSAGGSHWHLQFKLQGVGIGAVSGDSYQLHADFPEILFVPDRDNENAGGSSNIGFSFSVDAIGMGDAPNFHGTLRFQGTTNANGVITMDKAFFSETCN
ncbi:MAG: hypothetical protein ACJ76N_18465 [Thermoanaerobaculia bacterium]